jgi:hypothetical protein
VKFPAGGIARDFDFPAQGPGFRTEPVKFRCRRYSPDGRKFFCLAADYFLLYEIITLERRRIIAPEAGVFYSPVIDIGGYHEIENLAFPFGADLYQRTLFTRL